MKRVLLIVIGVLFLTQSVLALTPIGPPTATLEEGKYELGFNYLLSEMYVHEFGFGKHYVFDFDVTSYLPRINVGLGSGWQFSAGLGVSKLDTEGFHDSSSPGVLGLKKTFSQQGDISWGAAYQVSWSYFSDSIPGTIIDLDLDYYEMQLAIGPTYKKDGLSLYGGPFLHMLEGKCEASYERHYEDKYGDPAIERISLGSSGIEQKLNIGGFAGLIVDLTENINLGVEAQFVEDAEAIVFRIGYRF